MALTDPLSLREVRQLSGSADTILLTATRNADLETPIGAFHALRRRGPAFLLESVEAANGWAATPSWAWARGDS